MRRESSVGVEPAAFLAGGKMGTLMRAHDWSATPLGPPETWPQSLRTALALMLASRPPVFIAWGTEQISLYNDGYIPILGAKHPAGLGKPFSELWAEVWDELRPLNEAVFAGEALWFEDRPFALAGRDRSLSWFNFSYTPLRGEDGRVAGIYCVATETTERVLAERHNVAERERLDRMFDQATGFMAMLRGPEHVLELANAAYMQLVGHRDVVGRPVRAALPEVEGQVFLELLDNVFSTGEPFVGQAMPVDLRRTPSAAVEQRFVDLVYQPVTDATGTVTGIFVEGSDVTERVAAEAELRALNADLKGKVTERAQARSRTWEVTPDLMGALNSQGYFETSNPAWMTVLGWTEAEVAAMPIWELLHPDDLERTQEGFQLTQIGQPAIQFPNRYRRKDGGYRRISWVGVPEDGYVYCVGRDITGEHDQAEALAELTAERDRIWQTSPDLLAVLGFDGVFRRVNPAWTAVLGYEEHELVGTRVDRLVHPDDVALTEDALTEASCGPLLSVENRYRHKDGTYRWISWITPAPEGSLIFATGRHITVEREAKEALVRMEEQLRQSQKMEAVGQLTGGLAHDFNNLLAGITGSLELLSRRMAQGRMTDIDRYVTAAQGAAKRAAALTHRLLAFSRRQTLDPKPTNVNRLVAGMDDLVRRTVGPEIGVEVVAAGGLWLTLVDPNQLENALLNLCINARDAMPEGGKLTIETANRWLDQRGARERDLVPGQYISMCVSDNGTGMSAEVVAKAFDPFFTTKPIGQGTGLGLSMIYGFARQSGGQVRIYSEPGQGTMMCLYLPRHHGEAAGEVLAPDLAEAPRAQAGETVLVVDDEPTVRMLVTEVLEELGYAAIEAGDGSSGLKVLQSDARIDLLVTDVGLPGGMNGRQMADAARATRPSLKVLFITGYAENAVVGHGHLELGMHVMTKPFALEALALRIKELIGAG